LHLFEILLEIGRKLPFEPTSFGAIVGAIPLEFRLDFWHQKTSPWALALFEWLYI